ncbi:hypothetical protein N7G274_004565 [Stereocaulon virgatum]|uniref:Uncharacterized protein n=1 Tax=Stereocaulon virgatum TaxID=373712 RepID=A0ABR4ABH4_9LECA
MDGGRMTRAMSRKASERTTPPTPRRSSIWQLNRRLREAEEAAEEAAAAAPVASPAPYFQAMPPLTAIPLAAENPQKSLSRSPRRPRGRPLEQPNSHVLEPAASNKVMTPEPLGPSPPSTPLTIEGTTSETDRSTPRPWGTADSDLAHSAPTQPSPVDDFDASAASAIQIGIDEWIASEQRRQIAADTVALHDLHVVHGRIMTSDARVPVHVYPTTQSPEPASVLDSEWLAEHQNTAQHSGLRFARPADLEGLLGPGLETITGAYLADQDSFDASPAAILSNPPNDIGNPFPSNLEHLIPSPTTPELTILSLPPDPQTQQPPTPPAPSGLAPPYHIPNLCIDPTCPVTHSHEQGLYVARPERPRMWNVCWGYSDPPEEVWDALTAMAQGRAVQWEKDVVHGFSGCHFWPGVE